MNPYRIYRDEWAKALAKQITAEGYATFVAMPFREHFSYRAGHVLDDLIGIAVQEANTRSATTRPFEKPQCVLPQGATVIGDEIVSGILESHIFLADLTFENPGVLLETGIALATKPSRQIILITQGSPDALHFDLRNNHVLRYNHEGATSSIADAFVAAANHFEEQVHHHMSEITRRLSPDAIVTLKYYGVIQKQNRFYSLHAGNRGSRFEAADGLARFDAATRELREKDLLWTDYSVGALDGNDAYGMHATELGWALIASRWPDLARST